MKVETNREVDDCLKLSEYFYKINTVCVKMLTTAPQNSTQLPKNTAETNDKLDKPVAVFTTMRNKCLNTSVDLQNYVTTTG